MQQNVAFYLRTTDNNNNCVRYKFFKSKFFIITSAPYYPKITWTCNLSP